MHTLRVVRTTQKMRFKSFKDCQNSCVLVAIFCLTNRFDFIDVINDFLDSVLKTERSMDCRRKIVEETVFNLNDLVRFWGSLNCKVGFDPRNHLCYMLRPLLSLPILNQRNFRLQIPMQLRSIFGPVPPTRPKGPRRVVITPSFQQGNVNRSKPIGGSFWPNRLRRQIYSIFN
jgi:hypothetical protein